MLKFVTLKASSIRIIKITKMVNLFLSISSLLNLNLRILLANSIAKY